MSKHRNDDTDRPILGARVLTNEARGGGYETDEHATLEVARNSMTGRVEVWADQINLTTGVSGRAIVNIRFSTNDEALAFAEAIVDATKEA